MAVKHIDNCGDDYSTSQITQRFTGSNTSGCSVVSGGRLGNCIKIPTNGVLEKQLASFQTNYTIGFGIKVDYYSNLNDSPFPVLGLFSSSASSQWSSAQLILYLYPDGTLSFSNDITKALKTSSGILDLSGSWRYVEIVITPITNTVSLYVDNTQVITTTTITTGTLSSQEYRQQGPATGFNADIVRISNSITNCDIYIDDLYIIDPLIVDFTAGRMGDICVQTLFPASSGTYQQFGVFPPGNSHYLAVYDRIPDNASSYTYNPSGSIATSGQIETYLITSAASSWTDILSTQINYTGLLNGSPGSGTVNPVMVFSGLHTNSDVYLTNSWKYFFQVVSLNPSGPVPWTYTDFNTLEIGIKNTGIWTS